jgi:uncharacterized protein
MVMKLKNILLLIMFCTLSFVAASPRATSRIQVMILDGESGGPFHKWQAVTPILKKELDETGLFDVTVVTAPGADGDFSSFRPEWSRYGAVVLNYDAPGERWPEELKNSFDAYVSNGGGLVVVHAADNAFGNWTAYNEMIGVGGWRGRNEETGPHWFYKDGKVASDDSAGSAGSHGLRMPFQVTVRADHPITHGLPQVWMHQPDELYANLRGPGKNMTILATSYSDPANKGTGFDEPALMVISYGKGRVFHSTFGHDGFALSSVDAVVTFQRGAEWAATGKVTQKVPSSFPTANTASYRTDIAAMDPNSAKGFNLLDTLPQSGRGRGPAAVPSAPGSGGGAPSGSGAPPPAN